MINNIIEKIIKIFKVTIILLEYIYLVFCINRAIRSWTYIYFYIYFKYVDLYVKKLFNVILKNDVLRFFELSEELNNNFYIMLLENSKNINNSLSIILYNVLGIILIYKIRFFKKLFLKMLTKLEKPKLQLLSLIVIFTINYVINFLLFRNIVV